MSFDGTSISVFELKKEIILANNLGKATDFDLVMFDGSTGEGPSITSLTQCRRFEHIVPHRV